MPKRYRLLKDHPYAKAGTIVEEYERKNSLGRVKVMIPDVQIINIPLGVEHDWLEEVKEDVRFTREQVDAIRAHSRSQFSHVDPYVSIENEWLDSHTLTEE